MLQPRRAVRLWIRLWASLSIAASVAPMACGQAQASAPSPQPPAMQRVGVGIGDITGEASGVGMMGYAQLTQTTAGIHLRLRARAFIVQDVATQQAVVIVITDTGLMTQAVHQAVLARLAQRFGSRYTAQNVVLSATHTHAGPGGYSHYTLYNLSILGFAPRTFQAIVDGIVEAITQADTRLAPGDILFNQGELTTASRNRSASAFRANPPADRAVFPQEIDPLMTVLTFRQQGRPIGALSLFPTHGTSMTNTNRLISGDNKGYAAYAWEHDHAGVRYRQDRAPFVAAFGQTNPGDMSPNLNLRPGSGPTDDEFENTRIIGARQANRAMALSQGGGVPLTGPLDTRMRHIDMSKVQVDGAYTPDGQPHTTCPAALGAAFAAGSEEDGPGPGVAREGEPNPFLTAVGRVVFQPSEALRRCHGVKQVVIPVGTMQPPWAPEVLPIQLVRIGPLYLATLPGEPTIMSGWRIRRTLARTLGTDTAHVLVLGYTNAYTEYITTPEEYAVQDYEGGSTLFGPYTLPAYQQELDRLAKDMAQGRATPDPLRPRDLSCCQHSLQPWLPWDLPGWGRPFGSVLQDARPRYAPGATVAVRFQAADLRNNLRRGGTFLEVQRQQGTQWTSVADDGDWSTRLMWSHGWGLASQAEVRWAIPSDTPGGHYRIVLWGDARGLDGDVKAFSGQSRVFQVGGH